MGHSEGNALPILTIRRWSRLQNSFHHTISPGWSSLTSHFLPLKVLPQRLLNLRQPVLADRVCLHRLLDLRDELVDVWLFLG